MPSASSQAKQIGDMALKSQIWAIVTRIDNPAKPGEFTTISPGNKLVIIDIIVGNDSDQSISVSASDSTLVDVDGLAVKDSLFAANHRIISTRLSKGERAQGEIAFEVPASYKPALLRLRTSFFGGTVLEMGLAAPALPPRIQLPPRTRPAYPKSGETAEAQGYTLSAVGLEPVAKPGILYLVKKGYKLVGVEIVVGNTKADSASVNELNASIVDTRGFVWPMELAGRDGKGLDAGKIGKGERMRGWVAFEMPDDAIPDAVRYDAGGLFDSIVLYAGVSK
ncbi:Domain of unknown function DUF4352 [uncultured Caudovirales phage]|uniref:DUF4352 domain-containing protein n=1 Tax=uncultured Caudovirales phage TaxID=2100421 RepID=A0A6J5MM56_9CAUD|nr:Domain of unknown function DUF4352 [uncultured Caudovirales phage]